MAPRGGAGLVREVLVAGGLGPGTMYEPATGRRWTMGLDSIRPVECGVIG